MNQDVSQAPKCGIDIVEIERFKRFIDGSQAQLTQLFTTDELRDCDAKKYPSQSLAGRFAIKEACLKCFPRECDNKALDFIDIEVAVDNYGAPFIRINDKLHAIMQRYHIQYLSASLSHTEQYACGIVTAN